MHEIGIESSILQDILDGKKTIEGRLGHPKYLKIKAGDQLSLREDVWMDGVIVDSVPDRAVITVTQVLYFESFEEMLNALNFKAIIPSAETVDDAIAVYRQFYSEADEFEYGVVALLFRLA